MDSLQSRLKAVTSSAHAALEASPFHQALLTKRLPKAASLCYLHCLAIVHSTLERSLATASDARLASVWDGSRARLPLLLADLERLGAATTPGINPAVQEALHMAAQIVSISPNPIGLLGYLYVLEGSRNGGLALKNLFAESLGVHPKTLSYFGHNGSTTRESWARVVEHLNSVPLSHKEVGTIESTAVSAFDDLRIMILSLFPYREEELEFHVTALNPEAGTHGMPKSLLEVDVAIRAGVLARECFPYLDARFGERGKRFTTSDSAWLLTLMSLKLEAIRKSIAWLRTVLASRGLPTVILESHMTQLVREFETAFPERAQDTSDFKTVVAELKAARESGFPPEQLTALLMRYDARLSSLHFQNLTPVAALLASAYADEMGGIPHAYAAVRSWLTDPGTFGQAWITSIDQLSTDLELLKRKVPE